MADTEYRYHLEKLMMLLEKDMAEIGKAVRGETCDEYRKTVQKELDILQNVKKESYYFN